MATELPERPWWKFWQGKQRNLAERKSYRLPITFKSGITFEVDVMNPDAQVDNTDKITRLTWENPESATRRAYVDVDEIAGITVHEIGGPGLGPEVRS